MMEWIEGLGEINVGWDIKSFWAIDRDWHIKGICLNDTILYWNNNLKFFKDREPSPTCSFDSLNKTLDAKEFVNNREFVIYPNPASGNVKIKFYTPQTGNMTVYNQIGQLILESDFYNTEHTSLIIPDINKGLLYIKIDTKEFRTTHKIIRVDY